MDSSRSAKRRKLNIPNGDEQKSSPASHVRSTPITYSKKKDSGRKEKVITSKAPTAPNGAAPKPSSAHLAWQEAKAKSKALRGKRLSNAERERDVDVYEDFEGAHGGRKPEKIDSPSTTPQKKQLDLLRNQQNSASAAASPFKSRALLGFFKQFTRPKSESQPAGAPATDSRPEEKAVVRPNGLSNHANQHLDGEASAGAENETEEPHEVKGSGKGVWKGWAYETGPKKTLEDEIRELGNVAREQAEKDDDGGPADAATSSRRKRNRVSKFGAAEDVPNSTHQGKRPRDSAPKHHQLVHKLKQARKDPAQPSADPDAEADDAMDIDGPDVAQEDLVDEAVSGTHTLESKPTTILQPQQRSKSAPSSAATFAADNIQQIQTILLEKLTGRRRTQLTNMENEYSKVSSLVSQTITAGESNSMLLIGARGSGKSALVNQILYEQSLQYADDFHVVRLNGFIHTDDKIALREIWRQLGREMELDGDENTSKNYADTLTTLLALLSHPAELGQEQRADQVTKSVIFIIDEFDLFANHPRQTLLYNLFDIAQSRKAPIAVLGLTTRIDVAESLEKRVKSRFSHRYVHIGFTKSFVAFQEACKSAIALHFDELSADEREALGAKPAVTEKLVKESKKRAESAFAGWNRFVNDLLHDDIFTNHLRRIYYTTKSVPEFQASMLLPVSMMAVETSITSSDLLSHFTDTLSTSALDPPDSNLTLLHSLSTLHLALLICAARLTNIHSTDVVPFAQAYEEYKGLASKQKLQASASGALAQGAGSRVWSKDVAKGAWEDLITFGLVIEDGSRGVRVDAGLEEIGMSGADLGSWGRWCREI